MMSDLIAQRPEGLYCPAGDFHIDPWQPVPRAVITHGHGDHARSGMGCYHVVDAGLPILQWRLGEQDYRVHEHGQRFSLGRAQVSLHPAGHVLGSTQVRVEVEGQVWVASGDYKRQADPTCVPFEVVPCDTFITEATFGLPVYRWPPMAQVIDELVAWRAECAAPVPFHRPHCRPVAAQSARQAATRPAPAAGLGRPAARRAAPA